MKKRQKKIDTLKEGEYVISSETTLQSFTLRGEYKDFTGESNDGMRRSHTYTVRQTDTIDFELLEVSNGRYIYKMTVTGKDQYGPTTPLTGYDRLWSILRTDGAEIIAPKGAMAVSVAAGYVTPSSKNGEMTFSGAFPLREGENAMSFKEYMELMAGPMALIAGAVGDNAFFKTKRFVDPNTLPEGFEETRVDIETTKDLDELLAEGAICDEDVERYLDSFIAEALRPDALVPFLERNGGIGAERVAVTAATLPVKRRVCPEKIVWGTVARKGWLKAEDLDLIIEGRQTIGFVPEVFLTAMKGDRVFEEKIARNAMSIFRADFPSSGHPLMAAVRALSPEGQRTLVVEMARKGAAPRDLQAVIITACEESKHIDFSQEELPFILDALKSRKYMGGDNGEGVARLLSAAGRPEDEILEAVERLAGTVDSWHMRHVYEDLSLQGGLAKVEAREREIEARQAAEEARQKAESLAVLDLVKTSNGFVKAEAEQISALQREERNHLFILEGRNASYLLDIDKAKNAKNGVLHLDVDEADAGWIIGAKGAKIKETTEKLNKLGCNLRMIKLHTY